MQATAYVPVQILTSGPDSEWRAIRQLYFAMIMSAQQRVRLQSPFFILDATIAEALRAAALAGIEVEVMVSDRGEGLNQTPYWAANTYLAEVAAAGARVHMYGQGLPACQDAQHRRRGLLDRLGQPRHPQLQHQLRAQRGDLRRAARAGAGGGVRAGSQGLLPVRAGRVPTEPGPQAAARLHGAAALAPAVGLPAPHLREPS